MAMRVEAIVAGAGPAGSLAAMLLARRGWQVLLVDRGPAGRRKTCGHCLGPRAVPLLRRHGLLAAVQAIAEGFTRRLSVRADGRRLIDTPIDLDSSSVKERGGGLVVDRRRLDPLLQEAAVAAGVEYVCPGVVVEPRLGDSLGSGVRVNVRTPGRAIAVEARLLVAADGVGSGVARALGWANAACAGRRFGVSFQCAGETVPTSALPPGTVSMRLRKEGYLGLVRQNDWVHAAALLRPGVELEPALRAFASDAEWLPSPTRGCSSLAGTGPLPWHATRMAAAGCALVGDAAGYAEPFTGEGMTWALESAELLVGAIPERASERRFDTTAAARYVERWQATIGAGQRRCRWLAQALDRPWLIAGVAAACRGFPPLAGQLVRSVVCA
ncbi:MAG: FAD-dependent monooxygenase [Phycisphaerales bacterium]|nr:FAD-dependent monooxygenase [Phycisphaerales bacterium]